MTIRFPYTEFFEQSGNTSAIFNEQLRDLTLTFACNLWANYPAFITQGTNPGSSFARGFMNQACSPVQPAVPAPSLPFVGGQCPTTYFWDVTFRASRPIPSRGINVGDSIVARASGGFGGAIDSTFFEPFEELRVIRGRVVTNGATSGAATFTQNTVGIDYGAESPDPIEIGTIVVDTVLSQSFSRVDGLPDNCGNLPSDYPDVSPTSQDLVTNVVIVNLDGVDNTYEVVYNKISNQYNFPMGFKINGVNAVLDLSGLTIYGAPEVVQPTSGNDVPPPGSDGGDDGAGGENDKTYPDTEYPVLPNLNVPTVVDKVIEYVVCNDGVTETVSDTLKLVTATIPYASLIVDILANVVTDVCEIGDVEATVGLPEYYGLRPGAERPAIVYLYKELINGVWQKSTYSSTVSNPSPQAISDIGVVEVADKTMGSIVYSLTLKDGSRIKTSGDTEMAAQANFNFLLEQVAGSFIPTDIINSIVVSEYPKLQQKTVKCRQIEYYPSGKSAGVSPLVRRVIDAP